MSNTIPTPGLSSERAIYGFVLYLVSFLCLGIYIIWAYVPEKWLHAIGLTYWPQKYWALAFPCYMVFCIVFLLIFYTSINFTLVLPLDSIHTVTDKHWQPVKTEGLPEGAIPALGDLSLSEVNQVLYS